MPNSLSEQFLSVELSDVRRKEIVTVGRIDDNKNQKMLVEAFAEIKEKFPEWSLHLYGDGDRKKKLEEQYGAEQIVFHGQTPDVVSCIKDSSIFVLPSRQEGMPNALIEAMALRMACISTDCPCGGPADLINSGENGILIPVDDKQALKEQLASVMSNDELRRKLGENARASVEKLNPETVNGKWKEYIERVCRKSI